MNEYQCPYCLYGQPERDKLLNHLLNCHPGRNGKVLLRKQYLNAPNLTQTLAKETQSSSSLLASHGQKSSMDTNEISSQSSTALPTKLDCAGNLKKNVMVSPNFDNSSLVASESFSKNTQDQEKQVVGPLSVQFNSTSMPHIIHSSPSTSFSQTSNDQINLKIQNREQTVLFSNPQLASSDQVNIFAIILIEASFYI